MGEASKSMMKENYDGRVMSTSSVGGLMGNMGQVNYSATKGGQIAFIKALTKEWARFSVKCNAVAYGGVRTRLTGEKEAAEVVMGEKVSVPAR
jgi:3-oxoacyl-[acyl-carrier protein] reductase